MSKIKCHINRLSEQKNDFLEKWRKQEKAVELRDGKDCTMYEIGFAELRFAPVERSAANL